MSTFPGLLLEYSNVSIDRFDGDNLKSTTFFLSHNHRDHTVGLFSDAFWTQLNASNYKLYCTPVTKHLLLTDHNLKPHLQKYPNLSDFMVCLEPERSYVISVPDPNLPQVEESFTVTCIPAAHCPGSAMFLFEGRHGNVLYTGDFRLTLDEFKKIECLKNGLGVKELVNLYIDSTFCVPEALYIPSRQESAQVVLQIVGDWLEKDEANLVLLQHHAGIGYEQVYREVFNGLGHKVHVMPWKFKNLSQVGDMANFITQEKHDSRVHACTGGIVRSGRTRSTTVLPCGLKLQCNGGVMTILLSTMAFVTKAGLEKPFKKLSNDFYRVCYSFHPSYSELREIIKYLRPIRVYPNVVPMNRTHQEVQQRLNRFLEVAQQSTSISLQCSTPEKLGAITRKRRLKHYTQSLSQNSDLSELNWGETPGKKTKADEHGTDSMALNEENFPILLGNGNLSDTEVGGQTEDDDGSSQSSYRGSPARHSDDDDSPIVDPLLPEDKQSLETCFHPALDGMLGDDVGYASEVNTGEEDEEADDVRNCAGDAQAHKDNCEKIVCTKDYKTSAVNTSSHEVYQFTSQQSDDGLDIKIAEENDACIQMGVEHSTDHTKDTISVSSSTQSSQSQSLFVHPVECEVLDLSRHQNVVSSQDSAQDIYILSSGVRSSPKHETSNTNAAIDLSLKNKINGVNDNPRNGSKNGKSPVIQAVQKLPVEISRPSVVRYPTANFYSCSVRDGKEAAVGYTSLLCNISTILASNGNSKQMSNSDSDIAIIETGKSPLARKQVITKSRQELKGSKQMASTEKQAITIGKVESASDKQKCTSQNVCTKPVIPECIDLTVDVDDNTNLSNHTDNKKPRRRVSRSVRSPKSTSASSCGSEGDAEGSGEEAFGRIRRKPDAGVKKRRDRRRHWLEHDRCDSGSDTDFEPSTADSSEDSYDTGGWYFDVQSAKYWYMHGHTSTLTAVAKVATNNGHDVIVLDDSNDEDEDRQEPHNEAAESSGIKLSTLPVACLLTSDTSETSESLESTEHEKPSAHMSDSITLLSSTSQEFVQRRQVSFVGLCSEMSLDSAANSEAEISLPAQQVQLSKVKTAGSVDNTKRLLGVELGESPAVFILPSNGTDTSQDINDESQGPSQSIVITECSVDSSHNYNISEESASVDKLSQTDNSRDLYDSQVF